MPFVVRCEHCGASLKVRDENRGKRAKCPKCQELLELVDGPQTADAGEFEDAGFRGSLNAPVAATRSQGSPRAARPNPPPAAAIEPGADEDALERRLMTARPLVRVVVLIVLLIPVLLSSRLTVLERLLSCIVPVMLTGTYRIATIRGEKFVTRFFFAFYPIFTGRCKMQSIVALNVKYGHVGSGMGTFMLFGPAQVICGRLFDFLIPAIGGPYQIHLVTAKGRELCAWQGFNDANFQSTLDMLLGLTNAEIRSV
jgi:phage FluMu protein Com